MFKKLVLAAFAITLISGVSLTLADSSSPSSISTNSKLSVLEESLVRPNGTGILLGPELSAAEEPEVDPDLNVDPETTSIGEIHTQHGHFVRVEKQTIFNESEIAGKLNQIGPKTKQLTLNVGIFLRKESDK